MATHFLGRLHTKLAWHAGYKWRHVMRKQTDAFKQNRTHLSDTSYVPHAAPRSCHLNTDRSVFGDAWQVHLELAHAEIPL